MRKYYSITFLERTLKRARSIINASLLKNGYSNFTLEILEYCDPEKAIEREQYYLDLLKPDYNILKTAGSSLGFKHPEGAKTRGKYWTLKRQAKHREYLINLTKTLEWREKNLEHMKNLNANQAIKDQRLEHLKRLNSSEEHKAKISASLMGHPRIEGAGRPSVEIEVLDMKTGEKKIYPSMNEAARAIGVSRGGISQYFSRNTQKPYKGRYVINKKK
jgi:group I intron endonuclease